MQIYDSARNREQIRFDSVGNPQFADKTTVATMDLRAMLNTDAGGGGGGNRGGGANLSKPPPTHQHQPPQPPSASTTTSATTNSATPATPVQPGPPPHSFRDYSHSTHASPIAQPPDFPPSSAGPYASPTSYHPPANAFPGRPPVPPLQPPASHDLRSPGSGSLSGPSPYRPTPTSSISAASGGYPFPTAQQVQQQQQQQQQRQQQPPASPVQRHQYGSASAYSSRDSYGPQPQPAPPASAASYMQSQQQQQQQQQPLPQTPPVGTPGGSHQYLHQRSISVQSTPTPTSAHSQQNQHAPYGPPYAQGSPIAATHQHQHQSSQPPTPLGPPMPGLPRHSPVASFQQPPSTYQQKPPSAAAYPPPQPMLSSPPPPPSASAPRLSTVSHSAYDTSAAISAAAVESHRRSQSLQSQQSQQSQQSRSERERSMSVSPKTRVPSLPISTGQQRPPSIGGEPDPHPPRPLAQVPVNSISNMDPHHQHQQREVPAVKRKLDDRDLRPDELENHRQPPPPPKLNGNHAPAPQAMAAQSSASPVLQRRRRVPHSSPPAWAQCGRKCALTASRNFSLKQHTPISAGPSLVNGNQNNDAASSVKSEHVSRHTSPETARSVKTEDPNPNHVAFKDGLMFDGRPFPWEPSIENSKPLDVVSRSVADFLVLNVLSSPNNGEILARGVQFEIEAKLGTIIDKSTNERIYLPIQAGECILGDGARIAFRSSMTENQHRVFNDYLNEQVKASYHRNPNAASRVPVQYIHRREVDRFYELPNQMRQRLPACVSGLMQANLPVKARVSHDLKTGAVLAKIVKARVADFHIHFPHMLLDCRISINLECDWDGSVEEIEQNQIPNRDRMPDRVKDRLSYKHGFYQIDLTQVTQGNQAPQPHGGAMKEHELEIELDSGAVLEHGRLLVAGSPNKFTELVDGLVDNVRVLARRCPPPTL